LSGAPAIDHVLGFDSDGGVIAFVDQKGQPRRLDLRASEVRTASKEKLSGLASANGVDIYGVTTKGEVMRLSPSGEWTFTPPSPARWVFPQPNGSAIVAGNEASRTRVWLIRPTDDQVLETASLPLASRGVRTQIGDRLYFTVDSGLVGVKSRDLSPLKSVRLKEPVAAIVPTPSGDRLYVLLKASRTLTIIDRYSDAIEGTVDLPGTGTELRMDPLGQAVLVRPTSGDSVWVVGVGSGKVDGTLQSDWRDDLPAFAPGSVIATVRGTDVTMTNAATLQDMNTIKGGAADFWYFFTWNGFRPRSADLDRPVIFGSAESAAAADSSAAGPTDSIQQPIPIRDNQPSMVTPPPALNPPSDKGYLVSFAAVLSSDKATEVAGGITINGQHPRVAPTQSGGTTLYRVVLGPYATREEADKVGKDSKRQYWVYEASQ
jgi:cell division septation protein DedD